MLQKPPDDAFHANVLRQPLDARAQTTNAAHHKLDLHPRLRGLIQGIDDKRVDQRIHLRPNRCRPPRHRMIYFVLNMCHQSRAQSQRRHGQFFQIRRFGIAGKKVEHSRGIGCNLAVAGKQRQIGIGFGVLRMIITRSQMHISPNDLGLTAHHKAHFGVGFQLQKSVNHLHARAFHIACQTNVRGLIKARFQLHQRGDRLARLRRFNQRLHNRAVFRGAIERLFDRHNIGVERGLA